MRCNVCGADNLEGSAYCEDCGARLPAGSSPAPAPVASAPVSAPVPAPPPVVAEPVAAPVTQEQPATSMPPSAEAPLPPVSAEPVAAAPSVIVCPACGANNLPGVAFCEDCGASLSDTPATAAAATAPPVNYDATPHPVTSVSSPVAVAARSRLVLTNGKGEFPLEKDTILMGRRSPVDGIFPEVDLTDHDTDSYISRRHGRITRQDSGFVYEDLGSSNGSWVNGTKMQPHVQQPLRDGDGLRLGKTEFVVRLS